jgi:two-component system alkaline phosphatase synthesis response regulator PhoP
MGKRILLVEDESRLALMIADRLHSEGYEVDFSSDGIEALSRATTETFDLIVLDIMLPRKNGFDVCRDLRQRGVNTPILMLTARGDVADRVVGLKLGADDYLAKPFVVMELMARMEALLRRAPGAMPSQMESYQFGEILIDFRHAEVKRAGKRVELSGRELDLLRYLVEHRGVVLSREELQEKVWGYGATTLTRTVDVNIAWLRQKLEKKPRHPRFILTVRGFGYRFVG